MIANLPSETTTRILLNDALRQKLRVEDDIAKQVELVREALIEENKKAELRLEEERVRSSQLQQSHETLRTELSSATAEVESLRGALKEQEGVAAESKAETVRMQQKLIEVEESTRRVERQRFVLLWLAVLVVTCTLIGFGLSFAGTSRKTTVAAVVGSMIVWMWLAEGAGRRSPAVREWKPYQAFERFRLWVYGTLLAGTLGNAVWDGIKYFWNS